ncbi:MAG: MATE family efflux transporter [Kofleriaceae bacterium]|nr:MATE family efflux transporter [Kofleriaceae bacterium]
MSDSSLTRVGVIRLAIPVMFAQVAIAATGVVDTAVMGLYGTKIDLAAVAIASMGFSFVYWAFGFLRMSTTGLVAQALGAGMPRRARAVLQRALLMGGALGVIIWGLSPILPQVMFLPFGVEAPVEELADAYFSGRIWGAPALLMTFAMTGWLLGTGRTGALLALQIAMNGVNAALDYYFVSELGWGPYGIGMGTAIAEWVAFLFGVYLLWGERAIEKGLFHAKELLILFSANRDILIRTLALLFSFAWFVRSGASLGTATLAGNEVLLQFVTVAAFVLDGFAFVAEKEIGEAYGAQDVHRLRRAMRVTTELSLGIGLCISLAFLFVGPSIITSLISDAEAREVAVDFMPYCALIPLVGIPAWQLDGFFLGATQGAALRKAALISSMGYVLLDLILRENFANQGVWLALLAMYLMRAAALAYFLPALVRSISSSR